MDVSAFVKTGTPLTGGVDGPSPGGEYLCFRGEFSTPIRDSEKCDFVYMMAT